MSLGLVCRNPIYSLRPANVVIQSSATGNSITNITSAYGSNSGPTWHTVHICNPALSSSSQDTNSACQNITGTVTVGDTTIYQAQSIGPNVPGPPGFPSGTIVDDLTQTAVNSSASPAFVAMYSMEEVAAPNNAYSRFTTAPGPNIGTTGGGIPNWGVGNASLGTGATTRSNQGQSIRTPLVRPVDPKRSLSVLAASGSL